MLRFVLAPFASLGWSVFYVDYSSNFTKIHSSLLGLIVCIAQTRSIATDGVAWSVFAVSLCVGYSGEPCKTDESIKLRLWSRLAWAQGTTNMHMMGSEVQISHGKRHFWGDVCADHWNSGCAWQHSCAQVQSYVQRRRCVLSLQLLRYHLLEVLVVLLTNRQITKYGWYYPR